MGRLLTCSLSLVCAMLSGSAFAQSRPVDAAQSRPADSARQLLRDAIDLYVAGQYKEASARLGPLVRNRILRDRADQKEALRIYGITLYLSGAHPGAERTFRDLLRRDPGARLDPSFVRPEVVAFFERVRKRLTNELEEETRKRGPKGSAVVNLIPPWGQFQNSHRTKGYILLAGELALIAASITSAGLLYSWRSDTGEFENESTYDAVAAINLTSFIGLGVLLVYGAIDGLYYYYRGPRPAANPVVSSPIRTTFRF